ncbi:hypothetical protein JRQ81_004552 [Phrynocephalus forsythii]|uniref:C-type lectin domain-containing protein n=1 Tax=Phrynocephalus forsythii TaxID=171643 RepID=A0A9Q0XHE4_9SAUR|nr:hypothetical protein JRQ81_004552 [Phrynocephalus forsythii]
MATAIVNPSASDASPTVAADDQDFQSLDVGDENGRHIGNVPPLQRSSWRRRCPTNRLVLLLVIFCAVLTISVAILGAQGVQFKFNQRRTQEAFKSFNKTVWAGIDGLRRKRTKSGCCPKNWQSFQDSCYWFPGGSASWENAKRNCEEKNSHLVIINSPAERVGVGWSWPRSGSPMEESWVGRSFSSDLSAMETSFQSVNHTIVGALAALKEKETNDVKRLAKVDQMVKNLTEVLKEAKTQFKEHISKLRTSVHALNCHLEDVKRNQTGGRTICCPKNWLAPEEEAKADCENKDAKLVIIAGYQEQEFVAQHTKPHNTWIGLRFVGRTWKWVDGTTYTVRRIDWRPMEPDRFSESLLTGFADCAHLYRDGRWSDDHCTLSYNWVCESEKKA